MPALTADVPAIYRIESAPFQSRADSVGGDAAALAKRLELAWDDVFYRATNPSATNYPIDVASVLIDMERTAKQDGIDIRDVLKKAGRHFTNPTIRIVEELLSEADIDALLEDDRKAFDEHGLSGLDG